jgi:hypothetical protein
MKGGPSLSAGAWLLMAALLLNLVSYLSWGRAIRTGDLSQYVRNHAVRELVYGVSLTVIAGLALFAPQHPGSRVLLTMASGGSVLGFWVGLGVIGGLSGIDRVFPGQSPAYAFALHGPQLLLWGAGLWTIWTDHRL